jgi:membrane protease YdiL (CAAX protease family)
MPDHALPSEQRVPWGEVALFFAIATGVSAPFRLGWVDPAAYVTLPFGMNILFKVLRGIGPAVGFIVMRYVLHSRVPRTTTFWGIDRRASLVAALVIPLCLAFVGTENNAGLDAFSYGLLGGLTLILYALGEEFGWRGYLQQALSPLTLPVRIVAIGTIWYLWHLNFLNPNIPVSSHISLYVAVVLGSWGLMKITDGTRSILFAAAVHLSFNLFADSQLNGSKRLIVICIAAAVWTGLIIALGRKNKPAPAADPT